MNDQEYAEQNEVRYNFVLMDMADLIKQFGPSVILKDLREFHPKQYDALVSQVLRVETVYEV